MNSSGRKWREFPKHVTTCTGLEQPLREKEKEEEKKEREEKKDKDEKEEK